MDHFLTERARQLAKEEIVEGYTNKGIYPFFLGLTAFIAYAQYSEGKMGSAVLIGALGTLATLYIKKQHDHLLASIKNNRDLQRVSKRKLDELSL